MNQITKFKKEKNQLITESEIESKLDILVKGKLIIRKNFKLFEMICREGLLD